MCNNTTNENKLVLKRKVKQSYLYVVNFMGKGSKNCDFHIKKCHKKYLIVAKNSKNFRKTSFCFRIGLQLKYHQLSQIMNLLSKP